MSDPEDADHTRFFRLTGDSEGDDAEGTVVSAAAFQLHGFAMINSVRDGSPGFISDDYLNAISAETAVTALELCSSGLWDRDDVRGGYIINDPMVAQVVAMHERMETNRQFCDATGGHEINDEFGPDVCCKCLKPI